ncbi:MAG: hypothetical protein ACXWJW_04550 [Xanthobacteraceae bacterium]
MKAHIFLAVALALFALVPASAFAADRLILVTAEEAALPPVPTGELARRGVTRGPKVSLVSPASVTGQQSPVHLQLKFESFGGAKIDPNDVKVVYLKKPVVDLSQRVKPFTQGAGIDIGQAEMPPGDHTFRIDVKDSDGRIATALFTLNVVP